MSALGKIYFKLDKLETMVETIKKKQSKGVEITFSINDETDQYGQNVASWVSQTQEQREAKKDRYFVGNGALFYISGEVKKAERKDTSMSGGGSDLDDDLPF